MEALLLEKQNVKKAFGPADMDTAQVGSRISLAKGQRVTVLVNVGASTGATVVLNLKQHNAASGGTSKALSIANPYFHKVGAADVFTKVEPSVAADSYDLSALLAANAGLVALEVLAEDLDVSNDFSHISVEADDTTVAKLGAAEYHLHQCKNLPAYSESV